jgi:hypothetical protein
VERVFCRQAGVRRRPCAGDDGAAGPHQDGVLMPLLKPPPDDRPGVSPVAWAIDEAPEEGLGGL